VEVAGTCVDAAVVEAGHGLGILRAVLEPWHGLGFVDKGSTNRVKER